MASADGSSIRTIVEATPHRYVMPYLYHADISPDGSQIVYTSCQFPTEIEDPLFTGEEWYYYEIATVGLDGGEPKRLTENRPLDHVPVWSPDGTRIAFLAFPPELNYYRGYPRRLYTMAADGTDVRDVVPSLADVVPAIWDLPLSPPEWSPDGKRLAFLVEVRGEEFSSILLYTVAVDGSDLQWISETVTSPSWSPDGEQLAFGKYGQKGEAIYTVRPDGTNRWRLVDAPGVKQVSWSPDGKEILFVSDSAYVVHPDGSGSREVFSGIDTAVWSPDDTDSAYVVHPDGSGLREVFIGVDRAAWSPDGSRIAFYDDWSGRVFSDDWTGGVVSIARDGTDLRLLAKKIVLDNRGDSGYEFVAGNLEGEESQ